MGLVVQEWVGNISYMKQSVLLTSIRGPDGIHKNHVSKKLCRWLRRCVLISAFDKSVLLEPFDRAERRGGSFTGPSCPPSPDWRPSMDEVVDAYMLTLDEVPHHFQLHFLHASEVLGYHHPMILTAMWWKNTYERLCNDMHLRPETHEDFDRRLGDSEADWRAAEEVRAD